MDIWDGIKTCLPTRKINYLLIPVTNLGMSQEAMEHWNSIFRYVKKVTKRQIKRTPSGGISRATMLPSFDVRRSQTCVELTYLGLGFFARVQFRSILPVKGMNGRKAFIQFKKLLQEDGIDIKDYAVSMEEGKRIKRSIVQPPIGLFDQSFANKVFTEANHIDFHSSFPSGLCNTHEEFRPTIQRIYNKRHEDSGLYKAILNYSIGFMQSISGCGARYSQLSKDAIEDNNKRIYEMTERLIESGRVPLLFNTDGIWYMGKPYHGEGEGSNLGEWHNDHINCKFRAKSGGAYEYIENGVYYPVIRGVAKEKSSQWSWGGIYHNELDIIKYKFDEKKGIELL